MLYLKATDFSDQEHTYGPYKEIIWEGDHLHSEDGALIVELEIVGHTDPPEVEAWCTVERGFYAKSFHIVEIALDNTAEKSYNGSDARECVNG